MSQWSRPWQRAVLVYLQAHYSVDPAGYLSEGVAGEGLCQKGRRKRRKFAESVPDRRELLHQHVLWCVCVLLLPLPPLSSGIAGSAAHRRVTFSSEGKCGLKTLCSGRNASSGAVFV